MVPKRHDVAMRLLAALKEEAKVEKDADTSETVLRVDALARARLIEVSFGLLCCVCCVFFA